MLALILFFKVSMGTNPIAVTEQWLDSRLGASHGAVAGLIYVLER